MLQDQFRWEKYNEYLEFIDNHLSNNIRKGNWQARRFAQEDWLLCVWVFRLKLSKTPPKFEIGLFLAEDHAKFIKNAGAMGGLIFSLSEAYNQLGKMELHFTGKEKREQQSIHSGFEQKIPDRILEIAKKYGITLSNHNHITDAEGRALYAAITGLSRKTTELAKQYKIDIIHLCFVIQRSIWKPFQVDYLVSMLKNNDFFYGAIYPEHDIEFQLSRHYLREALLVEYLLEQYFKDKDGNVIVSNIVIHQGYVSFDMMTDHEISSKNNTTTRTVKKGEKLNAMIFCQNKQIYEQKLEDMLEKCNRLNFNAIVLSRDSISSLASILRKYQDDSVLILPTIMFQEEIDDNILRRIQQSATTQRALPTRQD